MEERMPKINDYWQCIKWMPIFLTTCKIRYHVFTTFDARIRNVKCKNKNVLEPLKSSISHKKSSRRYLNPQFLKNEWTLLITYVNIGYLKFMILRKFYSAGQFPDFRDLNNLKENRSFVIMNVMNHLLKGKLDTTIY